MRQTPWSERDPLGPAARPYAGFPDHLDSGEEIDRLVRRLIYSSLCLGWICDGLEEGLSLHHRVQQINSPEKAILAPEQPTRVAGRLDCH